ncbi:MAG TPA: hypothetical protein VFO01_12320 [Trebonia sp.]|nr:hypothetical protein [Trebonia sp.]
MFVSDTRLLTVGFDAAAPRLARLGAGGWLHGRSEAVYDGGVEYLLRVGPLGALPGASKLVRVRLAEPVCRDGVISVGMRWEAAGPGGRLFPALDADVRLGCDGGPGARVTLTGSYRPPLGAVGGGLDRLLLHTVATATVRALLTTIADALEGTPATASAAAGSWRLEPEAEPASADLAHGAFPEGGCSS